MKTKPNQETERNQIKHAYSYIRLSSKRQTDKDKSGIDRQLENFKTVCERFKWIPQTQTFRDLGVSGFDGSNFNKDLGEFMTLAKENKLAEYPVLVIESLDRFSRQDIDESEPAVIGLLRTGVAIHVKFTGQTFTKGSTVELGDRIVIMVALKSAFNYSQQLSERVTAAKNRKLARLDNGENVNIRDYAPRWIGWNKESKTMFLNKNAEAVRNIFKEYQAGKSLSSICRFLHDNDYKSFHGGNWTKQTVRKILSNPATYGEFKGKPDIFPKIVEKNQFDAIQLVLDRNAGKKLDKGETKKAGQSFGRRGRTSKVINIFRGLLRCSSCGGAMSMHAGRSRVYYKCDTAVSNACDNHRSVRMSFLESGVIGGMCNMTPEELLTTNDKSLSFEISQLTLKRDSITKKIDALLELAGIIGTDEIRSKMTPLKIERDELDSKISTLQNQVNLGSKSPEVLSLVQRIMRDTVVVPELPDETLSDQDYQDMASELVQKQLAVEETRKKLATVVPTLIKRITITGNTKFEVQFVAGGIKSDTL